MENHPSIIVSKEATGEVRNLSNSDFRRLIAQQPRQVDPKILQSTDDDDGGSDDSKTKKKAKSKKRAENYRKWQEKKEKLKLAQKPKYRDRAKERREQANPDYKDLENYEQISVENSKFLGGDVEHTHLVKGLDFALMSKYREQLEKEEEQKLENEYKEGKKREAQKKEKKEENFRFVTALGRSIHRILIDQNISMAFTPVSTPIPAPAPTSVHTPTTSTPTSTPPLTASTSMSTSTSASTSTTSTSSASSTSSVSATSTPSIPTTPTSNTTSTTTSNHTSITSNLNNNISIINNNNKIQPVEHFLTGRMTFEFELDDRFGGGINKDIPTTLMQSRSDCPQVEERVSGSVNDEILKKVSKIFTFLRQGTEQAKLNKKRGSRGGKNKKKKDKNGNINGEGGPVIAGSSLDMDDRMEDDIGEPDEKTAKGGSKEKKDENSNKKSHDDEIFTGFGTYDPIAAVASIPTISSSSTSASSSSSSSSSALSSVTNTTQKQNKYSYFPPEANDSKVNNDPISKPLVPSVLTSVKAFIQKENEEEKKRQKTEMMKASLMGEDLDDYAECYPAYESELHSVLYESDDEDLSKMDQANRGKPKLKPWDFSSDEQWEKYNRDKEATPKAAFQFGQKMKDGRVKGAKRARSKQSEEQKLNKEWQQIQQIMKNRTPATGGQTHHDRDGGADIGAGSGREMSSKRQKILLRNQR